MTTTFIMGWTGHHNLGDEAFKPAIQSILEDVELTWGSCIPKNINDYDALVVGGGSFLDQPLNSAIPLDNIKVPIGFLGVGIHSNLHIANVPTLARAQVVVTRNHATNVPEGTFFAPDLLFARDFEKPPFIPSPTTPRRFRLLILPNGFALPFRTSPQWLVDQWHSYESIMSGIIGSFAAWDWEIDLQPMCAPPGPVRFHHDDRIAALRLITQERVRRTSAGLEPLTEDGLLAKINGADLIISNRFHGCVLATILGRPFVGVGGHEKLKSYFNDRSWTNWVSYDHFTLETLGIARRGAPTVDQMITVREEGRTMWRGLVDPILTRLYGAA